MNRFPRALTAAVVVVMLAQVSGGVWFYRDQERQLRHQVEGELAAIARLKVDQIAAWRAQRLDEGAELVERFLLGRRIAVWLANPRDGEPEALLSEFRVLQQHEHYSDVLLVDKYGRVRLSLSGRTGIHENTAQALATALRDGRPELTELHTEADDPRPRITVAAPLFTGDGQARRPLGAVILVTDARQFLYPLIQSWPTPSKTAETLLVRRDGNQVLYLNDLRHQADTALKLRIPLNRTNLPAVMAVLGKEGVVEGLDYRGVEVISVLRAIPNSPWFMVAKVDAAEAFAGWRTRSVLILILLLGLVVLTVVVGLVVWERKERAHFQALLQSEAARRQSEERHRIMLMSVGDGVIATDAEGRVEIVNPVAQTLTGWAIADARGRSLDEVFRIVNEETRQPVESPVARVLREGLVVGLANHTMLVARDGTERPIADSGAPIRGEDGSLTGVVLVFRDQTAERAAMAAKQEFSARQEALLFAIPDIIMEVDTNKVYTWANQAGVEFFGKDVIGREAAHYFIGEQDTYRTVESLFQGDESLIHVESWQRRQDGEARLLAWRCRVLKDPSGKVVGALSSARDNTERKRLEQERIHLEAQLRQQQKLEAIGTLASGVAHETNNPINGIMNYAQLIADTAAPESRAVEYAGEIVHETERVATIVQNLLQFARQESQAHSLSRPADIVEQTLSLLRAVFRRDQIALTVDVPENLPLIKCRSQQIQQVVMNLLTNARDALNAKYPGYHVDKTIRVGVKLLDHDGRRWLRITVADQGNGIPAEIRDRIFDPFFTTKPRDKGSGLGLSISHGIAKEHHGVLHFETDPGTGTQFHLDLPVDEEE